ncbi:MAG TPA: 50S ribosomal protein L23 [Actinomycetota bacterium]|nr:50S ribosomal protein L23 [Actinomycetota bacterium]
MKSPRDIIVRPIVSEKSYAGLEGHTYTFLVAPTANKTEIKEAIQQIWNVRVEDVRTMNRRGKVKRTRLGTGKRPDQKRAVVKLAAGDTIEIFETRGP